MMKKTMQLLLVSGCMIALAGCGEGTGSGVGGSDGGRGDFGGTTTGSLEQTFQDEEMSQSHPGEGMPQSRPDEEVPQSHPDGGMSQAAGDAGGGAGETDRDAVTMRLRIVDGAESGNLILAGEERGSLYALSVQDGRIPVYLDGKTADYSVLEDGMSVEVSTDGSVLETYPCQLAQVFGIYAYSPSTGENEEGFYDLCGLYLQVLNDLWDKDTGLNEGIRYVGVDLSEVPGGLTQGEKDAVAWIFANQHNGEALPMSYEELVEQGYLTKVEGGGGFGFYQWEDGILFSITASEPEEEGQSFLPTLYFRAGKWRGSQGAYYFNGCHAVWSESGTWDGYEIGGEMIS